MKKKKKKTRRIGRGDSVDSIIMGDEPTWKDADKLTPEEHDCRVLKALNWYSYSCEDTLCKPWTIDWMMKNEYSKKDIKYAMACNINALEFIQVGSRCRIMTLGAKLDPRTIEMVRSKIKDIIMLGQTRPEVDNTDKEKVNVQERIQNKTKEYMSVLEGRIDELFELAETDELKNVDHADWLVLQGIKHVHFKKLAKNLDPYIKELKQAYKGDPDLKEAFSFLGKRKIKLIITALQNFKDILND